MKDVKNKTDIHNTADVTLDGNQPEDDNKSKRRRKFNVLALVSIILAIVAWILLSFDGPVALGTSIVAFLCACFGLKASTRSWRNTAITAIVASSVLMVVLTAFLIVLYVGLESV